MKCPTCGYLMPALDKECERCAIHPAPATTTSPPTSSTPSLPLHIRYATLIGWIVTGLFLWAAPGVTERVGAFIMGNPTPITPFFRWQSYSSQQVEELAKDAIDKELTAKNVPVRVESVFLVEESPGKFSGYVDYTDKSRGFLNATIGSDGKSLFNYGEPSSLNPFITLPKNPP